MIPFFVLFSKSKLMDWIDVQWTIAITKALYLVGGGWPVSLLKVPKAPVA